MQDRLGKLSYAAGATWRLLRQLLIIKDPTLAVRHDDSIARQPLLHGLIRSPILRLGRLLVGSTHELQVPTHMLHSVVPSALSSERPIAEQAAALLWWLSQSPVAARGGRLQQLHVLAIL